MIPTPILVQILYLFHHGFNVIHLFNNYDCQINQILSINLEISNVVS